MKFEGKDGLNIIADSWGSDSDPLVILLHGGGQTRHAWGESGELLSSSGFYVLALDLRGHGDSDWHPEGDYSIESHKEDLIKILDSILRLFVRINMKINARSMKNTVAYFML